MDHRSFDDRKQNESVCGILCWYAWCSECVSGPSLAFADADDLQKKVERLRSRVRELEDALHTLQSNVADHPHPLLGGSTAVDSVTSSPIPPDQPTTNPPLSRDDDEFIDAFGIYVRCISARMG